MVAPQLVKKMGLFSLLANKTKIHDKLKQNTYKKPISNLVFDDRLITASSEHVRPQDGLNHHWVSLEESRALLDNDQIEPNAASLLDEHLTRTAA